MATPIDVSVLQNFSILFPFLLTFALMYGLFTATNIIPSKATAAFIAIILAFLVLLSDTATAVINLSAPWFILLIFLMFFILFGVMVFGFSQADIIATVGGKKYSYIIVYVVGLSLVIGLGSLANVLAEQGGVGVGDNANATLGDVAIAQGQGGGQLGEFWNTVVHPKFLGMVLVLLISVFTVSRLTSED